MRGRMVIIQIHEAYSHLFIVGSVCRDIGRSYIRTHKHAHTRGS